MGFFDKFSFINEEDEFPDAKYAPSDYPLAFGWTLSADLMLKAYQKGIFAWSTNPVTWWSPNPRAIFDLEGFHVSKSLAKKIKQSPFTVTIDRAFLDVIYGCAEPRKTEATTWISEEFVECFTELFKKGNAHSIECWQGDKLVGGVFGVAIGGFFSAESMFHRSTDASKIALYYLIETLRDAGFSLFDIQVLTPHTQSLGAFVVARSYYLQTLKKAVKVKTRPLHSDVIIYAKD